MKTTIENYKGEKIELELTFIHLFSNYGRWEINCECRDQKDVKYFKCYTNDSEFIDKINDIKNNDYDYDKIQKLYFDRFISEIENEILEWL